MHGLLVGASTVHNSFYSIITSFTLLPLMFLHSALHFSSFNFMQLLYRSEKILLKIDGGTNNYQTRISISTALACWNLCLYLSTSHFRVPFFVRYANVDIVVMLLQPNKLCSPTRNSSTTVPPIFHTLNLSCHLNATSAFHFPTLIH